MATVLCFLMWLLRPGLLFIKKMSKEISLKDFYTNPEEEEEEDSEQDSDFVPDGMLEKLFEVSNSIY